MEHTPLSITIVPFNPLLTQMNNNTNSANAPYYDEIHRYCVRLLKSETEADDITQEVFVRLYKSGYNLEGEHLRNWLFRVARNLAYDKFRAKHPELRASDEEGTPLADMPDNKSANPAATVEQQDLIQKIGRELKNSERRIQEILRLKFVEGKSSSEIGAELGIAPSTVRKNILGILQKLREALQKELAFD